MRKQAKSMWSVAVLALLLGGCYEVHGSFDVTDRAEGDGARVVMRGAPVVIPAGHTVAGDLVVIDGTATIDGEIKGNLVVIASKLRVGPTARIHGELVSVGNDKTDIAKGAVVKGEKVIVNWAGARWAVDTALFVLDNQVLVAIEGCVAFLVLLVLAWLVIIRPYDSERFHETVEQHPVRSGLLGFLIFIGLHVLMLLALLSRYAIGILPVLGFTVLVLSVLGWIVVGGHVGRWMAQKYDWKVGPFWYGLAGVGIACGAFLVPVAGQLVTVLASFVGIGALLAPVKTVTPAPESSTA